LTKNGHGVTSQRIRISHYSDALCVWAYVSQIRIDELLRNFGNEVEIDYRFTSVFGNVVGKMESAWKNRGGMRGYSAHVREIIGRFDYVILHKDAWRRDVPTSSMPAHLFLCAVRLLDSQVADGASLLPKAARAIRTAFFAQCRDISRRDVLLQIAREIALPADDIERFIDSGAAYAALAEDFELARNHGVQASPTLLFNEGRQRLTGNVGYRIIEANIRELLEANPGQLSWC
jgi:predicted DsbA family dithiol-disulfide isomerase